MRPTLTALALFLTLSACADPLTQCLNQTSRDQRILSGLIAETEQNLARGYALADRTGVQTDLDFCLQRDGSYRFCEVERVTVVKRPVAIDVPAEQAKLAALKSKLAEKQRAVPAAEAQCRATYPARG